MTSVIDGLLHIVEAKQDQLKASSPAGSQDSSQTNTNEEDASQQSTSTERLEIEKPKTKKFRPSPTTIQAPSAASFSTAAPNMNLKEFAQNIKALRHQMDLVMKTLNVTPCECKDCSVVQKRWTSESQNHSRHVHAAPVSKSMVHQNGDSMSVLNSSSMVTPTPSAGMATPANEANIAQALVEQTHCPTTRGRGRGRPMLIGDELHNALVDYLVNLEIVNNTRLYPMDALKCAREFIKQHSPGLLSDEGGSVDLKQSWAVKLASHVRTRKQKLIDLVANSQSTNEKPADLLTKLNKEAGISTLENNNALNGLLPLSQQHVVPEQHCGMQPETMDTNPVTGKLGFDLDLAKFGLEGDPVNLATFVQLVAQLQQSQTAQ
ncbi:hypothetical protein L596_000834 [Steinernema carpocapsae]|uniref:Uncharacterized protein n=1 Tax=Steinernema carpocapsae TaxID=34508 RepID=A0A4U8UK17_STECR|nr:hypothetical protein L596_000834 [Steinernema carpocapsae]